jgi:hypothetical protein
VGWKQATQDEDLAPHPISLAVARYNAQLAPTGKRLTEYDYAVFAAKYVDLCEAGESGIHDKLADRFGITPANSRQRLHRAREKGLLMGGRQGRAGGLPL